MTAGKFDWARSRGDIITELAALRAQVRQQGTARSLGSSTVSDGGEIHLKGGAGIRLEDGASLGVYDGGFIGARYPSGRNFAYIGPFVDGEGNIASSGLLLQKDVAASEGVGRSILEAMQGGDGLTHIYSGRPDSRLNQWWTWADFAAIDAAEIVLATPQTTTDLANVVIDAFGFVRKVTSSAAYKLDIQPLLLTTADVLQLEPRTWLDRGQVERDEPVRRIAGFVAEDVAAAAAAAPALEPFLIRDDTGAPAGVAYDRVPAAQQLVLRDHEQRLAAAEAEIAALRETVTALTKRLESQESS